MSHHQERVLVGAPPLVQVLSQPCDRLNVEMVGGLIEHDDVPVSNQQLGKRGTAALPAGELPDFLVQIDAFGQPAHDVTDAGIGGPFVFRNITHDRLKHAQFGV